MDNHESPIATFLPGVAALARFAPERMQKLDCVVTDRLLLGLNCFEPGQAQRGHAHAVADKFYLILSGRAKLVAGSETRDCGPGDLVFAPAGALHGVESASERIVMLVGMTR